MDSVYRIGDFARGLVVDRWITEVGGGGVDLTRPKLLALMADVNDMNGSLP
jgi:hypothetical protein